MKKGWMLDGKGAKDYRCWMTNGMARMGCGWKTRATYNMKEYLSVRM